MASVVTSISGGRTQERGRQRRAALVEAARLLLNTHDLDTLTLAEIGEAAGIPKSSAYHLFSDVNALWQAVAQEVEQDLIAAMEAAGWGDGSNWQTIVADFTRAGVDFFNRDWAAAQLLIGPKTLPVIKLASREGDHALARLLHDRIARHFKLAIDKTRAAEIFFHAIEIADLFFGLSVIRHRTITPAYRDEAVAASIAYLTIYLPGPSTA